MLIGRLSNFHASYLMALFKVITCWTIFQVSLRLLLSLLHEELSEGTLGAQPYSSTLSTVRKMSSQSPLQSSPRSLSLQWNYVPSTRSICHQGMAVLLLFQYHQTFKRVIVMWCMCVFEKSFYVELLWNDWLIDEACWKKICRTLKGEWSVYMKCCSI